MPTLWNRRRLIFGLHIEEQSESATQGTLDFDEPEESVQQKDDQLPRHTAIVGLLARNLANSLDQREQFALLDSVEIPVSRVLYGMEHAGAQVDMNADDMREQLASDAESAQNGCVCGRAVICKVPNSCRKFCLKIWV